MKKILFLLIMLLTLTTAFGCNKYVDLNKEATVLLTVLAPEGVEVEVKAQSATVTNVNNIYEIKTTRIKPFIISLSALGYKSEMIHITEKDIQNGIFEITHQFGQTISKEITLRILNQEDIELSISQTSGKEVSFKISNKTIELLLPDIYSEYNLTIDGETYQSYRLTINYENILSNETDIFLLKNGFKLLRVKDYSSSSKYIKDNNFNYYKSLYNKNYQYYSVAENALIYLDECNTFINMSDYGIYDCIIQPYYYDDYVRYSISNFSNKILNLNGALAIDENNNCEVREFELGIFGKIDGIRVNKNVKRIIFECVDNQWFNIDLSLIQDNKIDYKKLTPVKNYNCRIRVYNQIDKTYLTDFDLVNGDERVSIKNGIYEGPFKNYSYVHQEYYNFIENAKKVYDSEEGIVVYTITIWQEHNLKIRLKDSNDNPIVEDLYYGENEWSVSQRITCIDGYYTIHLNFSTETIQRFVLFNDNYEKEEYLIISDRIVKLGDDYIYEDIININEYKTVKAFIVKDGKILNAMTNLITSDEAMLSIENVFISQYLNIKTKRNSIELNVGSNVINISINDLINPYIYIDYNNAKYEQLYELYFQNPGFQENMEYVEGMLVYTYTCVLSTDYSVTRLNYGGSVIVIEINNASDLKYVRYENHEIVPLKRFSYTCVSKISDDSLEFNASFYSDGYNYYINNLFYIENYFSDFDTLEIQFFDKEMAISGLDMPSDDNYIYVIDIDTLQLCGRLLKSQFIEGVSIEDIEFFDK